MQHYIIHIDWLSVHGVGKLAPRIFARYEAKDTGKQSKNYKNIYDVIRLTDQCKVASVLCNPFSNIIDKNSIHMKIENRELWEITDISTFVLDIFDDLSIKYVGLSRVDFCADFDEFANRLQAKSLISNFLLMRYRKFGRTHYNLHGNQREQMQDFSYISFGKRTSGVMVYLYNKSLEMREVKDKPYIRAAATAAGISPFNDFWRLEISINTNKIRAIDTTSGEEIKLTLELLSQPHMITNIFFGLAWKYFRFHINDGKRDIKENPILYIFDVKHYNDRLICRIEELPEHESNRSDKIFIKKMLTVKQQLYALDAVEEQAIDEVTNALQRRYGRAFAHVQGQVESENKIKPYVERR